MAKKLKEKAPSKVTINDRNVEDFFMNEYFDYAIYTIKERALPSIIDGLKPGARKIMHAGFKILSTDKETKFIDLVGTTMSYSKYHHGDSSILSTIMTLSAEFNDNLAPLTIVGSGGELRNRESAAPRYLDVVLSKWAKLLLKDKQILEYNYDGDTRIEPKFYIPIIPLVLMSRTTGMATGYKYDAQVSYNPADIVRQCISVLETGQLTGKLHPHIQQFNGSYVQVGDRVWAQGSYEAHKDHLIITEFAPNETFASFEDNLKKLLLDGKIQNWSNESEDDIVRYRVDVNPSVLERQIAKNQIHKIYSIGEFLKRPTYTLLNEHSRIAIFQNAEDVLKYFVDFRYSLYDKLKQSIIDNLNQQIEEKDWVRQFIDLYLKGLIKINPDTSIEETYRVIDSYGLPRWVADIQVRRLSKEEYDKLTKEIASLQIELTTITNTTVKELYLQELKSLLKEMVPAFPLQPLTVKLVEQQVA